MTTRVAERVAQVLGRPQRARDVRMVPVAISAWCAGSTILMPAAARTVAVTLWAVATVLLMIAWRWGGRSFAQRVLTIGVVSAAAAAMVASAVAIAVPDRAAAEAIAVDGGRALHVNAVVEGKIESGAGGMRWFDAQASRITAGAAEYPVRVPVLMRISPDVEIQGPLGVGARVAVTGTAFRTDPGERAVFVITARELRVVEPPGVVGVAGALRTALVTATEGLPPPGAGLIPGLAVGDTTAVSPELDASMKASSLSHLTAVSGANCAIVVGLAFAAAAACGARRSIRIVSGVIALLGFVVLVTPEPSVVRAAAMAGVAMIALLLGRAGAGLSVVSLAVVAVLVADPWLAGSLGFSLSTAATVALLVLARPLAIGLARWMPRVLALALAVPLAAQLVCGPLIVLIAPRVPVYGVIANLIAAPAAPIATVVGLGAVVAAPLPWLQSGMVALAWVPSAWIAGTATMFASLPGGQLPWLGGWPGALALAAVGAAVTLIVVAARGVGGRRMRMARTTAVLGLCALVGIAVGTSAIGGVAGPLTLPSNWSIAACDIGQGDAILIRSGGRVGLIDTGPAPAPLEACLSRFAVSRLDLLVLTHFDLDHVGGVDAVMRKADVVLHGPPGRASDTALVNRFIGSGAEVVVATAGMHGVLGGAIWTVLWPPARSVAFPTGNEASVVIDLRGPEVPTAVFLGDMSAASEDALLRSKALRPPYEVVKVAHHGSADQSPAFYAALGAQVAVISVGLDNDYGHPRQSALDLLASVGAVIARTDLDGIVAVSTGDDGGDITLWRERAPPE